MLLWTGGLGLSRQMLQATRENGRYCRVMPFTPLHMGPGIAVKAVMQRQFSLMVFGWSQIVIDLQPLFAMITGKGELHGFSRTYIGQHASDCFARCA